MRLSIVVPTLGRSGTLGRCLERLAAQDAQGVEVIVVADATAPDVPQASLRGVRPGASSARNAGWRAAQAPLVLFLDDDVLAEVGLAAAHLAAHAAEPADQVAVLGNVRWADELRVTPFMRWLDRGFQFEYAVLGAGMDVGWGRFYTANVSVKRALLEHAGGFDEDSFPFHYEDLELGRRLHDLGLVLRYVPAARAEHLSFPTPESYRERMAAIATAERRWLARHPDLRPHFHDLLAEAAAHPPARGRLGRLLAGRLPGRVGAYAWARLDLHYRQLLAAAFLESWARSAPDAQVRKEPTRPPSP